MVTLMILPEQSSRPYSVPGKMALGITCDQDLISALNLKREFELKLEALPSTKAKLEDDIRFNQNAPSIVDYHASYTTLQRRSGSSGVC